MAEVDLAESEFLSRAFKDLDCSGQTIASKEFDACTFTNCDFSDTHFAHCRFIDCHFIGCNLSVCQLGYSRFSDTFFENCKVIGIDWTKAAWPNLTLNSPITFSQCILNDSSFQGLALPEMVIRECKAHNVDFREGDFSGADFTYTDLSHSLFSSTNLTGADFTESTNYDIDLNFNTIKKARFSRFEAVRLLESLDIELAD